MVEPTNNTSILVGHVLELFHSKYFGAVRSVAVSYSVVDDPLR